MDELARRARKTRRNPRSTWCFKHESFVGLVVKSARSTHPAKTSLRALQKWPLHVSLTWKRSSGNA
eukprot:4251205-Alexandrium_andersonii.AAC.1